MTFSRGEWVATLVLLLQLVSIAASRWTPARYFCWAPYDQLTDYVLVVKVGGRPLTDQEVLSRYRRPARGTDNRSHQHVIDGITGVETLQAPPDRAVVTLTYRINGRGPYQWRYP